MKSDKTVLIVLALASAAALAVAGGDDEPFKDLPPPPDPDEEEPPEPIDPDAPTVPIPTPFPGQPEGTAAELENLHQLETADDFARWGVLEAVEPDGAPGPASSVVVLGYDLGWVGRPAALDKVRELAATHPEVHFAIFDFAVSRRLVGEPANPLGYVATAVGPDGRGRVYAMVGRKKTLGPLGDGRWAELVRFAREGAAANAEELRAIDRNEHRYVVLVRPVNGQWEWKVWVGQLGDEGAALTRGRQATKALAFEAAQVYVMGLLSAVVAT